MRLLICNLKFLEKHYGWKVIHVIPTQNHIMSQFTTSGVNRLPPFRERNKGSFRGYLPKSENYIPVNLEGGRHVHWVNPTPTKTTEEVNVDGGFRLERWGGEVPVGSLCTAGPASSHELDSQLSDSRTWTRKGMGPSWLLIVLISNALLNPDYVTFYSWAYLQTPDC